MRSFARYLKVPASRLSEIFSGKRSITLSAAEKIADRLGYDPKTRHKFLKCVETTKTNGLPLGAEVDQIEFQQLSADAFCVISDWYHFAILSLIETSDFQPMPGWIAKRLGISATESRLALSRLERLGLIEKRENNWVKTGNNLTTTHEVRSPALRSGHRQLLEKSIEALESADLDRRDITSMIVAIDPRKIKQAKKLITQFRRGLCEFLEKDPRKEVYALGIQLIPLSHPEDK